VGSGSGAWRSGSRRAGAVHPDPVKRKALLEWRIKSAHWHRRYFSPSESAKRYLNRTQKEINESSLLEAKKSLFETRKKLDKFGESLRSLKENATSSEKKFYEAGTKLASLWGRIVNILDGYTPDWAFIRDSASYLAEYRGRGDAKPTRFILENRYERTSTPETGTTDPPHEVLTVLKESRKRRNGLNGSSKPSAN
jgi:hypothetical protein